MYILKNILPLFVFKTIKIFYFMYNKWFLWFNKNVIWIIFFFRTKYLISVLFKQKYVLNSPKAVIYILHLYGKFQIVHTKKLFLIFLKRYIEYISLFLYMYYSTCKSNDSGQMFMAFSSLPSFAFRIKQSFAGKKWNFPAKLNCQGKKKFP